MKCTVVQIGETEMISSYSKTFLYLRVEHSTILSTWNVVNTKYRVTDMNHAGRIPALNPVVF